MEICRRVLIYGKKNCEDPNPEEKDAPYYDPKGKYGPEIVGGINNGYDEEELKTFYDKLKLYAQYLFNKSHAAVYSVTTLCTAYLKKYHPKEFFAALLTMQTEEEKINLYCKTAEKYGIKTLVPDINLSDRDFKATTSGILYGLNSIKGVGESSLEALIANRPYTNLASMFDKLEKKAFNKRVGVALIKSGALNAFNPNRHVLLNEFYDQRKDKDERLNPEAYNIDACIDYEKETLGTSVSYKSTWETIKPGFVSVLTCTIKGVNYKIDKNNNKMAFLTLDCQHDEIRGIVFAKTFSKYEKKLLTGNTLVFHGKRDDKNSFIISKIEDVSALKDNSTFMDDDIIF